MRRLRQKVFFLLLVFPLTPTALGVCAPIEATFFPQGVWIREATKLRLVKANEANVASFILPAQVDLPSIRLKVPAHSKCSISDFTVTEKELPPKEQVRVLKQKIEAANKLKANLTAQLRALENQLLYWQTQAKGRAKNMSDAASNASIIGKNIKKLVLERQLIEQEMARLETDLTGLEKELASLRNDTYGWEITVLLTGPCDKEIDLSYSYFLKEGGWLPLYRLEAITAEKTISLSLDGEVINPSREDWKNVIIKLSNTLPSFAITPFPHSIKEVRNTRETVTGIVWELGRATLPAGKKTRLKLKEERWQTTFSYLVSPNQEGAFLYSDVSSIHFSPFRRGKAIFLVDGTAIGKGDFPAADREGRLFFGIDPAVKVRSQIVREDLRRVTRSTKIINGKEEPIEVLIEEPLFPSTEERKRLPSTAHPPPHYQDNNIASWHFTLKAGEEREIRWEAVVDTPKGTKRD